MGVEAVMKLATMQVPPRSKQYSDLSLPSLLANNAYANYTHHADNLCFVYNLKCLIYLREICDLIFLS